MTGGRMVTCVSMKYRPLGWSAALLFLAVFWVGPARADVLPEPERPSDWDEHPAPTPEVPLDDALARRLLPLLALGMAGCTAAAALRRARALRSVRRPS